MLTENLLHFFEKLGAEWVLWLLVVLMTIAIAVIVERWLFFRRQNEDPAALSKRVHDALRKGGVAEARKTLDGSTGMASGVLGAALSAHDGGVDAVEEVIGAAIARERIAYNRRLSILGTLGNAAPFVGLFGTVIGILVAFNKLGGDQQGAQLKADIMGSIGEALVATAVGLAVAIPAVVAFNAFKNKIREMSSDTESVARLLLAELKSTQRKDS